MLVAPVILLLALQHEAFFRRLLLQSGEYSENFGSTLIFFPQQQNL